MPCGWYGFVVGIFLGAILRRGVCCRGTAFAPIGIAHEIACCCGCDHSDDDGLLETEHDEEHSNGVLFSWRMFLEVRTIA